MLAKQASAESDGSKQKLLSLLAYIAREVLRDVDPQANISFSVVNTHKLTLMLRLRYISVYTVHRSAPSGHSLKLVCRRHSMTLVWTNECIRSSWYFPRDAERSLWSVPIKSTFCLCVESDSSWAISYCLRRKNEINVVIARNDAVFVFIRIIALIHINNAVVFS